MDRAIVNISFDDGRQDNLKAIYEILIPRGLASTVNITTGYVDGSCPEEMKPSSKPAMTVNDVAELNKQPFVEIALHGDRHLNTEQDVAEGKRKIIEWLDLPQNAELGFASPSCSFNIKNLKNEEYTYFNSELLYVRGGLHINTHEFIRSVSRKVGRIINAPLFFKIAYNETLMEFEGENGLYSVPVLNDTSAEQVCALVDECIAQKKLMVLQFHSIVDDADGDDNWSWSKTKFVKLCDHIKSKCDAGVIECSTIRKLFEKQENG